MIIPVKKPFRELYTTKKPIILLTGGRGGAKSFNAALFIKRLSYEEFHKILFTRYTLSSAEISVIPEFKNKIELEGDAKYFNITSKDIENKRSKSSILFRGIKTSSGNQTANLKSIQGLTTFVVDEAEEWESEDDYEKLLLSIREKSAQNRVIIIMNPSDQNHFVYRKYIQRTHKLVEFEGVPIEISTHPDVCHIHSTYMDCIEHLSQKFLNDIAELKARNYERYKKIVLGKWAAMSEGAIFTNWTEGEFDASLPYTYGMDFGFFPDPTVLVKTAVDNKNKKIYAQQIFYRQKLSYDDIKVLMEGNVRKSELVVADSAEKRVINDLIAEGFNVNGCDKYPGCVVDRIRKLQDYQIVVTPDSHDLILELKKYSWLDKKSSTPQDENDHAIQAITYAADSRMNDSGFIFK